MTASLTSTPAQSGYAKAPLEGLLAQVTSDQWLTVLSIFMSVTLILLPVLANRRSFQSGTFHKVILTTLVACLPFAILWQLFHITVDRLALLAATAGLWAAALASLLRQLGYAQSSLVRTQRNAAATLDAIADAVFNVTPGGMVLAFNPVAAQLIAPGVAPLGRNIAAVFGLALQGACQVQALLDRCLGERRIVRDDHPLLLGGRRLRLTAGPIFADGDNKEITELVLALTDVTETIAATERLYYEATHDALTGLPNRSLVLKQLADVVSHAMQSNKLAAILFIDVDHFNRINDSLGHQVGDAILVETANRLKRVTGARDLVARWGGDEFVVVLTQPTDRNAVEEAAKAILHAAAKPIHVDNLILHLTSSLGVSIAPSDSIDVSELLAMADTAMARTKLEANGGYRFFNNSMTMWNRSQIDIETNLRRALQNNEFELLYQPQIAVSTGEMVGMEALLRWNREEHGAVPPDQFVPVAEEIGLIIDIGIWAIYRATRQLRAWADAGLKVVPVAVNVSARQCLDHRISQVIADAIHHSGIDPAWLKIELTESTAMKNVDQVASLLRSVHALGVAISVDDFGTGYSSLSFLKRFPISQLKIDRSFVNDITTDADDAAIVAGTIALAHGLGIAVVAEGVETEDQLRFLAARGCDVAQGYYFSQPIPASKIQQLLLDPAAGYQMLRGDGQREIA